MIFPKFISWQCKCNGGRDVYRKRSEQAPGSQPCLNAAGSSAIALVLKMHSCSKAVEILGNNLSIVCVILSTKTLGKAENPYPAEMSCVGIFIQSHTHTHTHTLNMYQPPEFTGCVIRHTSTSIIITFCPFQTILIPPLHKLQPF